VSDPESFPKVLVIGENDARCRQACAALEMVLRAHPIRPNKLSETAALLDYSTALVLLEGGDIASKLDALLPLCELPAGQALIALTSGLEDADLEHIIARLKPRVCLPYPTPAPLLRHAVLSALPQATPGCGARRQHRPATVLLGVSKAIRDIMDQIRQIAPSRIPVLIRGETGTGKELVARAIHEQSPRAQHPFVAVNCTSLPENLLEAELFGFRKGAFTGAHRDHPGLFVQANHGTLFLDEIGDTSPALQVKLLRAIEEQEIRPIGASESQNVDVRIVSATHQNLEEFIETGEFRQDLFYRLNTVTIDIPPLRRRHVDIPFLAQHFAEELGAEHARRILLDEGFLNALCLHNFPGNVRELRNAVERAIVLARPDEPVTEEHLRLATGGGENAPLPQIGTLKERVEQLELLTIRKALKHFDGNRTKVAEALGLSRVGLRQKMRRLGLEKSTH